MVALRIGVERGHLPVEKRPGSSAPASSPAVLSPVLRRTPPGYVATAPAGSPVPDRSQGGISPRAQSIEW